MLTHRLLRVLLACSLVLIMLPACGDDGGEHFDNLPDCVADHAMLTEPEAIAHCLVDFPELHPDFVDLQDCIDWVSDAANGGYTDSSQDACTDYFNETGG